MLAASAAHVEGRIGDDELRAVEDAAILEVLELQRQVGVDVYSDGEYRRTWFAGAWGASLEGIVTPPAAPGRAPRWQGASGEAAEAAAAEVIEGSVAAEKVRLKRRLAGDECAFLREHAPGPFKITLPSGAQQALYAFRPGISDAAYGSRRELADDLSALLADEVARLVDEGASYVQLDSLIYVIQLADPELRAGLVAAGIDPEELLDEQIACDNAALAPARAADGVVAGLHMCRGNNRSAWVAAGGYDAIAERAFSQLEVDRFLLEYDSERAGTFEPLRFVRDDAIVVLGLISTKVPQLESPDDLLRRIDEASRYVPVDRLALSPQCGFASTQLGNLLTWDDQRRKLELVVETARKVWG